MNKRDRNYFWWSPDKWCAVICAAGYPTYAIQVRGEMRDMTHHERRLFIRKLIKKGGVAYQMFNRNIDHEVDFHYHRLGND